MPVSSSSSPTNSSDSNLSNSPASSHTRFWVVIPAAGVGSRMQSEIPKQYMQLCGRSVLAHSAGAFLSHPRFESVYVGVSATDEFFEKDALAGEEGVVRFVGGEERANTVMNGLNALRSHASDDDWVWIHDAARPCLSHDDIDKVIQVLESAEAGDIGAILAARVVDTIKRSEQGDKIDGTVDREKLWRAFTPQVFRYKELQSALIECERLGLLVTDEASAIEQMGGRPLLIEGAEDNIKITRPNDLRLAVDTLSNRNLAESQNQTRKVMKEDMMNYLPRVGNGYDVHAFCEGDELVLGGVKIPHHKAFLAHSDGDVLIHAIMDAMLGALALGDIGKHFPDTDEKWKGANSRNLLVAVTALIDDKGYAVANLDSVIIAQVPKMAPHIQTMQQNIAEDLGVSIDCVSVKATTTERLGFTGREEGIACQASVLLVPKTAMQAEGGKDE